MAKDSTGWLYDATLGETHEQCYKTQIETCDYCEEFDGITSTARFDGATVHGPWAYMCVPHHEAYGKGLGLGKGQTLIYRLDLNKEPK